MRISDWSSDVCSSDLVDNRIAEAEHFGLLIPRPRRDPGRARRLQAGLRRLVDQRLHGGLQFTGLLQRIAVHRLREVAVLLPDRMLGRVAIGGMGRRGGPQARGQRDCGCELYPNLPLLPTTKSAT